MVMKETRVISMVCACRVAPGSGTVGAARMGTPDNPALSLRQSDL